MPTIRPYTQQISSQADIPGRRAAASDFSTADAGFGEGLQKLGSSLYDAAERSEVSDAHARLATARAEWTVHLQERAQQAQPGDPNFAASFNSDFAKYLDKAGGYSTVAGQRAYAEGSAELAAHFVQAAGVYQARSMGEKAKLDFETVANKSSLAVYNDPTQFDSALASLKSAVYDPNSTFARIGGARDQLFDKAKERMALAAVRGTINLSPELAQRQLTDGKWDDFIAIENRKTLDTEIKEALNAQEIERNRLRAADERAQKARDEATSSAIFDNIVLGKATTKDILNSGLKRPEKEALFNFMKARSGETDRDEKTYGPGFYGMLKAINTEVPPTDADILNAVGKDITTAGANQLMAWKNGRKTADGAAEAKMKESFLDGVKAEIEKSVPWLPRDSKGAALYGQYLQLALPAYTKLREQGKRPEEIMAKDGPLDQMKARFVRTPAQIFSDMTSEIADAPADSSNKFLGQPGTKPTAPASVTVPLATAYKSKEDVAAAFKAGKISRIQAGNILRENGWAQ